MKECQAVEWVGGAIEGAKRRIKYTQYNKAVAAEETVQEVSSWCGRDLNAEKLSSGQHLQQ